MPTEVHMDARHAAEAVAAARVPAPPSLFLEAELWASGERFRQLFDRFNDAIFLVDPGADRIVDVNPKACEMLGYARAELVAMRVSDVHPDEMPKFLAFAESVRSQGHGRTEGLTCLGKRGQSIPAEISAAVFFDGDPARALMLASVRDISERKRAQEALAQLQRRNELVLQAAGEGIYGLDAEGKTTFVNPAAARMLGWQAEELIGRPMHALLHHARPEGSPYPATACPIYAALKDGDVHRVDDEMFWRKDGSGFPVEYTSTPIVEDGKLAGAVVVFWDVTKRKQTEESLHRALAEVKALKERLQAENLYLQEEIKTQRNFDEIIGASPPLRQVLAKVAQVGPTDATVLIHGETGTGKELVARALHDLSARRGRPLVKVNCGAISAGLVESELFGHEKGAFTGALHQRIGRFELANGGTIFLDEVGELPPDVQVKLLRVLQEREFERVGSSRPIRADVRIIAATHRNLPEEVKAGRFRADLYYRLSVFPLKVPPLRERASDIPLIVEHLVAKSARKLGKVLRGVTAPTLDRLVRYPWPGNVRELENVIERAAIVARGPLIEIDESLAPETRDPAGPSGAATLEEVERAHILSVLRTANWSVSGERGAATVLGLNPSTLRSRMQKLGIRRPIGGAAPNAPASLTPPA